MPRHRGPANLEKLPPAIEPDGALLLVEGISNASNQQNPGDFIDVLMLTLTGGRERTESDFARC